MLNTDALLAWLCWLDGRRTPGPLPLPLPLPLALLPWCDG
jgi:hypothetical protein